MGIRHCLNGAMLALAIASGVSSPLLAQDETPSTGVFKSAQQLYDLCTSPDSTEVEGCDYFLMSAHDMMKLYGDTGMGGDKICLPTGTTALELRETLLAYWEADFEGLKYSAVSTVYNALVEAYGCE